MVPSIMPTTQIYGLLSFSFVIYCTLFVFLLLGFFIVGFFFSWGFSLGFRSSLAYDCEYIWFCETLCGCVCATQTFYTYPPYNTYTWMSTNRYMQMVQFYLSSSFQSSIKCEMRWVAICFHSRRIDGRYCCNIIIKSVFNRFMAASSYQVTYIRYELLRKQTS